MDGHFKVYDAVKVVYSLDKNRVLSLFWAQLYSVHLFSSAVFAVRLHTVHNDILCSMDKGNVSALVLLDSSANFEVVYHPLLLRRLKHWFWISGFALNLVWYLC